MARRLGVGKPRLSPAPLCCHVKTPMLQVSATDRGLGDSRWSILYTKEQYTCSLATCTYVSAVPRIPPRHSWSILFVWQNVLQPTPGVVQCSYCFYVPAFHPNLSAYEHAHIQYIYSIVVYIYMQLRKYTYRYLSKEV